MQRGKNYRSSDVRRINIKYGKMQQKSHQTAADTAVLRRPHACSAVRGGNYCED